VPVQVRETMIDGLLKSIVYIDLLGFDEKAAERPSRRPQGARGKPVERRPSFPGATAAPHAFPGATRPPATAGASQGYMPKIRGAITTSTDGA
jgi:hypothetical protein